MYATRDQFCRSPNCMVGGSRCPILPLRHTSILLALGALAQILNINWPIKSFERRAK